MVISSCSLAEARLLLDNFLKASIDKVGGPLASRRTGACRACPGLERSRLATQLYHSRGDAEKLG